MDFHDFDLPNITKPHCHLPSAEHWQQLALSKASADFHDSSFTIHALIDYCLLPKKNPHDDSRGLRQLHNQL